MTARHRINLLLLCIIATACSDKVPLPATESMEVGTQDRAILGTQPQESTEIAPLNLTPVPTPSSTLAPTPAGPFQPVQLEKALPPDLVSILHASEGGTLWLETEQEIIMLSGNTWETVIPDVPGELIGVDDSKRVWILSDGGKSISAWDGTAWQMYSEESGWLPMSEYGFIKGPPITDQLGQLWIVTSEDFRSFDGNRWTRVDPKNIGLSHPLEADEGILPNINLKVLDKNQELWMGSCNWTGAGPIGGQGVFRYDGGSWRSVNAAVSSGCSQVIVEDNEGYVWFGLDGDVWRYDPFSGDLVAFPAPPSPFDGGGFFAAVGDIIVDADGRPWADLLFCGGAGCGFGTILYFYDEGEWIEVIQEDYRLHDLAIDQDGNVWLLTPGGIYTVIGDRPVLFQVLPIQPNSLINAGDGQGWFLVNWDDRVELWSFNLSAGL